MKGKRTTRKRLYKSLWFWVSALLVSILITVTQIPIEFRIARAAIDNVPNLGNGPAESDNSEVSEENSGSRSQVNEIGIEASNFRFEGDYFWADICFDMPSQADWHVGVPTLKFKGTNVGAFEVGVIESEIDGDGFGNVRCEEVSFPVNGTSFSEFQIVIHRLEVSQPDELDCDAAQKELVANNSGIVIKCVVEEGYSGYDIVSRPEGMTDDEMYTQIVAAFLNLVDSREGPWILDGKIP